MSARASSVALLFAACLGTASASADPYRLRADAYFTGTDTAAGLFMLQGEARKPSWVDAEAAVWMGTGSYTGDVLSAVVRVREPQGRAELRLGRIFMATGGLRPVQIDGAHVTGRAPFGTSLEVFGGVPVTRGYDSSRYDWMIGQRLGQRIGEDASLGISYMQMRRKGEISFEEIGVDGGVRITRWLDGAFTTALDVFNPAVADARLSFGARFGKLRLELFGIHRSPSHLLPATSLFAALGDIPSERGGGSAFWRAAPRLDVAAEGSADSVGGQLGADFRLRSTLRLDDRGKGALALELRRQSVPGSSWSGARITARVPLVHNLLVATELEAAVPDEPRDRGVVWPWGLLSLRYRLFEVWELSGAVEAGASPTASRFVSGLAHLSHTFGAVR
ncbi:MAG: hypothetical protein U0359_14600 [Byssovorax sp.]